MPWLMKAEPDSRIVKGKDVKFSVDDFEEIGESPWDGVRSHEARNIMRDKMKLGDKVLFYHSNCKVPGVYALAEVCKEGYPDYTAWDESHPYYDPKSDKDAPTWYMVSVRFLGRVEHPVTLAFVKSLLGLNAPPEGVEYIGQEGLKAMQNMALINKGRLSELACLLAKLTPGVQPVEQAAYDAIVELGQRGGFNPDKPKASKTKRVKDEGGDEAKPAPTPNDAIKPAKKHKVEAKVEAKKERPPVPEGTRRSARLRK